MKRLALLAAVTLLLASAVPSLAGKDKPAATITLNNPGLHWSDLASFTVTTNVTHEFGGTCEQNGVTVSVIGTFLVKPAVINGSELTTLNSDAVDVTQPGTCTVHVSWIKWTRHTPTLVAIEPGVTFDVVP